MKTYEILEILKKFPVFNLQTLKNTINSDAQYAKLFLHRLKKGGKIFQIERNKYTVHKDVFVIASHIAWPSYISFWSALRYYNLTEQIPHSTWVLTTRKRINKTIKFYGNEIIFVFTKPKFFFGYKKIDYMGFEIFMAEPEKALIDSVIFKKISFQEISSVAKVNKIKIKKLVEFAIRTKNKAVIKRIGFLLDSIGHDYHKALKKYVYPTFVPLEYNLPPKGRKNEKWKVIENVVL